ncbi:MAG: DUF885 domain-containing protein [Parasphingorhabdus sp.]
MHVRKYLTLSIATATLAACQTVPDKPTATAASPAPVVSVSQDERINAWFDRKFEEQLAFSPIEQTFIGRKTDYGKIDDFSDEALNRQLAWLRGAVKEMRSSFDYDTLSPEAKTSYDMWLYDLEQSESALLFRINRYALHQHNGLQSFFPTFLINTHKVETEADMISFIQRLSGVATALDQLLARAKRNAGAGTRPPRFAYEGVIDQSTKIISGAPFDEGSDSAIWAATKSKLKKLVDEGEITAARAATMRTNAREALVGSFAPAYQRVIAWYNADMPNTDAKAKGAGALPNGMDYYNYRLRNQTTTNLTAHEIHNIGLSEVARLRADMEAIKTKVGFNGELKAFFKFIREDDQFYFSDDDAGADQYIATAKGHIDALEPKLSKYFGILPKADLEVRRVEAFRERDGAAQHYRSGTPDGSRPGIYYAHLSDMRAMPIPTLEVIAYHEGLPGHHMQISIAQELEGIPKFRTQAGYTAYSEGWGLYSEYLAKEMGGYENPYSEFGRLTSEIWRAIRLVVDTGLHAKGWSEQRAIAYFLENSSIPEAAVRSEVRRYLVNPGQATSYKIGMIKILELRARAKTELGEKFDMRAFHDTILGGGALPLGILEKRVDQWIAKVKAT